MFEPSAVDAHDYFCSDVTVIVTVEIVIDIERWVLPSKLCLILSVMCLP